MNLITVTFDSNVWEKIVDENKQIESNVYKILNSAIVNKQIEPYFFEGLATYENIPKADRKTLFKDLNKKSNSQPILSDYLDKTIPKALSLGFRFLKTPRIGGFEIPKEFSQYYSDHKYFPIDDNHNRLFDFLRFIESLNVGKEALHTKLDSIANIQIDSNTSLRPSIIQQTKNDHTTTDKQFAKGIAEWSDGDGLAAHYAYGIKYYCTNDKASGAGKNSVFAQDNLEKIKQKYNLNIVTPNELATIITNSH